MKQSLSLHGAPPQTPRPSASVESRPRDPDFVGRGFFVLPLALGLVGLIACSAPPVDSFGSNDANATAKKPPPKKDTKTGGTAGKGGDSLGDDDEEDFEPSGGSKTKPRPRTPDDDFGPGNEGEGEGESQADACFFSCAGSSTQVQQVDEELMRCSEEECAQSQDESCMERCDQRICTGTKQAICEKIFSCSERCDPQGGGEEGGQFPEDQGGF
jgi:hypothetical protein